VTRPRLSPRGATISLLVTLVLTSQPAHAVLTAPAGPVLVQPGRTMFSSIGQCTIGFLFQGSDGRTYATSAGHCAPVDSSGESSWPRGDGPPVTSSDGRLIGRFVYSRLNRSHDQDLSLFQVSRTVRIKAAMCFFGGPTTLFTATASQPSALLHYGFGEEISLVSRPRTALAPDIARVTHVRATGVVLPGDSGSAIETSSGAALGVITDLLIGPTVVAGPSAAESAGTIAINRLDLQLPRIQLKIHKKLTLLTAPMSGQLADDCA
jgi:hypothetical protein